MNEIVMKAISRGVRRRPGAVEGDEMLPSGDLGPSVALSLSCPHSNPLLCMNVQLNLDVSRESTWPFDVRPSRSP